MVDIEKYFGKNTKMKGMEEYFGKNTKMNGMKEYFGKKDFKGIDNVFKDVKKNFDMSMSDIQGKAFDKMIKHPEGIARKRMRHQNGLSHFGDFDDDKVPNILDCWPRDPMRQGLLHKMKNYAGGKGFVENEDVQSKEDAIDVMKQEMRQPKEDAIDVMKQEMRKPKDNIQIIYGQDDKTEGVGKIGGILASGAKGVGKGLVFGAKEVYKASPAYSTPEEKATKLKQKFEMEKIRESGRMDALKESEKMKAKSLYMKEFSSGMPRPAQRQVGRSGYPIQYGGIGHAQPRGVDRALIPASVAIKSFTVSGQPGYIGGSMVEGGPVDDFAMKVDDALGKGTLRQQYGLQLQQQQQLQQMRVAPQQVGQPQFQPEVTKMSPYSKRKVSYTRGPYRKRAPQQ